MEEKQIIKQFKTLKAIKPNKHWAVSCRKDIFANESYGKPSNIFGGIFSLVERHAVVFSIAGFLGLLFVGGLLYFNGQVQGLLANIASQNNNSQEMLISLEGLQGKLEGVKVAVDNLKNAKDPGQALAMTEVVKSTAKEGKEVVERIKKSNGNLSKQVLASLVEVDLLSDELDNKSSIMQKQIFNDYIIDLKQRSLSQTEAEMLTRAEEFYNNGKISEAMLLITRIGGE